MRVLIIISDILNFFIGCRILKILKFKQGKYFGIFKSLVIIELSGNLHFEGFMLTF